MRIHTQAKKKYDFYSLLMVVIIVFMVSFFLLIKHDEEKINNLKQNINQGKETLSLNNKTFKFYRADDSYSRTLGLSIFDSFSDNESMLFVFDDIGYHTIWMKNMKFPIDIVWLDVDKKIIDIKENAHPYDYPETYAPKEKSLYVIEFNAGVINKFSIEIGDSVAFQ